MSKGSVRPIDRTLSSDTTPGQSGPGSNGNEGIPRIPQSSNITEALTFDCLESYPEHSLERLTPYQRCSRCILQAQLTGPDILRIKLTIPMSLHKTFCIISIL